MNDILDRAEAIQRNAKSEWAVRSVQAAMALDLLPDLIAEIKQQAACVARIETAFTRLYVNELVGCGMQRDIAEKHAREALERIRGRKE